MLHLFLVDTALELIPSGLQRKPCVTQNIAKYGNAGNLLDTTLHHTMMKGLPDAEKRGRPDILHHFLLDALGSLANLQGQLKIYFHTPAKWFQVNSEMHCARDYLRFKSLLAQLLQLGHIPPEKPYLVEEMSVSIDQYLGVHFSPDRIIFLTKIGEPTSLSGLFRQNTAEEDVAVLIGGFQKGHFSPIIEKISGRAYSIAEQGLDSWVVVNRILAAYEFNCLKL